MNVDKVKKTGDAKKGGLLVGDSHAEGGMPAIVVDTGQPIEVEGGEVIINKEASKKYWKELSKINQSAGNGVPIPPPADFSGDVSQYDRGGKISLSDLKVGTKMELEHSETIKKYMKKGLTVEQVARSIAKDHLTENPNYYKILKKLKLAKGGEIVCRSCGNSWLKHQKDVGMNVFECGTCGSENAKFYPLKKAETGAVITPPEVLMKKGGALTLPQKEEIYAEWSKLVNMSKRELQDFYKSDEGKNAGLTPEKARALKISYGRESARWILKMLDMPYTQWTDEMWEWAEKQINFIKRMSGNKGGLYDEEGNKTRKHTSLLIWGHNPDKFKKGGRTNKFANGIKPDITQSQFDEFAKGGRTKKANSGGDCYQTAGDIALNLTKGLSSNEFIGTPYVVHAEVSGQGAIAGIRYGHAWVEDDIFVYDFSNGRSIIFPKQLYYQLGQVIEKKPKYYKYTFKEARAKMLESGHYGCWDLKTESGL